MQKLLVLTAGAALAITALTAYSGDKPKEPKGPKGGNHGTDIIHLSVQVQMDNGGIVTNASGSARINWNQQGNANHQSLQVNVRGLDADTAYELDALLNDDTNLTSGVTFTTDAEGNASISLEDKEKNNNGHGHGHAYGHNKPGHTKDNLPAALEPVGHINELFVLDSTGTNVVLTADFATASSFQYLVKRNISSDTVNAELRIIANPGKAQIRLSASGLAAGDYTLLLNDTSAATQTADDHGRVEIRTELANPTEILSVSSVSLVDAGTNVVVSTTLP